MALVYSGPNYLTCLSSDTKPTTLPSGFIAYETDNNLRWIWNGSVWKIQDISLQQLVKSGAMGMSSAGTGGAGDGVLNLLSTNANTSLQLDTTLNRKFLRATTTTTNGSNAGYIGTASFSERDMNPKLYCEFRLGQTGTGQRLFVGFQANTTAAGGSNDPLNALEGFYFGIIATDTLYQIMHNDNSGATVFTAVTAVTTVDVTMHKLWVIADEANTRFGISIDSNAYQYITTDIPAATTALVPHVEIETTGSPGKTLDIFECIPISDS